MNKFLKIKFPFYATLIIVIILFSFFYWSVNHAVSAAKTEIKSVPVDCPTPPVIRYALSGYHLVNPLLINDASEESKDLLYIKSKIELIISQKKEAGEITTASVYLRLLKSSTWMSINDQDNYYPASLMKVPFMMVHLHTSEKIPGYLNRELYLDKQIASRIPLQTFEDHIIEPGKSYKIGYLLQRMIVNSDNAATYLLLANLDAAEFKKLFIDLRLPEPDVNNPKYEITTSGYSRFFRTLYNATYLSKENSEFALNLLSQTEFKEGIIKPIPEGVTVAHKFGQSGVTNPDGSIDSQLHEAGIFYYKGNPYLLTVMTKGTHLNLLPKSLSDISAEVLNQLAN